ncbi:hypothetical protein A5656_25690 [Mycobacterium gordonae]|nr:hypothetical protein A5656_25690 [Mycobacterium gordonae]
MPHLSLMHGIIPAMVQIVTVAALLYALGLRKRLVAVGVAAGVVTVAVAHWSPRQRTAGLGGRRMRC